MEKICMAVAAVLLMALVSACSATTGSVTENWDNPQFGNATDSGAAGDGSSGDGSHGSVEPAFWVRGIHTRMPRSLSDLNAPRIQPEPRR